MPDDKEKQPDVSNENILGEKSEAIQRVALVSSSPSARSIVRVVVIVLIILAVRDLLGVVLTSLTFLLFMVVLAILFAYLINPLVDLIQRPFADRALSRAMPRPLAIAISFLIVLSLLSVGIYLLAPGISRQAREFVANIPEYTTAVQSTINDLNRTLDRVGIANNVQAQINDRINLLLDSAGTFVTTLLGLFAIYSLTYLPWLILVPILAFFFLKDAHLFRVILLRVFPVGEWRTRADLIITDVNSTLVAYTRAQLISCALIGVVCGVGFYLIGHDYALILGILAAIFELVPILGPLTIGIIATAIAGFESGWQALWTAVFLGGLRIVHDYFTYPRIVREGIHLHPLAVILSVLAGEQIAGIAGMFLSIPVLATLRVIYVRMQKRRRQAELQLEQR